MGIRDRLIQKIIRLDVKQLTWLELNIASASLDKNESDIGFINGVTQLQRSTDSFAFLIGEESFSEKDAIIPCFTSPQPLIG